MIKAPRNSQQRYRDRKKQKEEHTVQVVRNLQTAIKQWQLLHDIISDRTLLSPTHRMVHQLRLAKVFFQLFQLGTRDPGTAVHTMQKRFLQVNLTSHCQYNNVPTSSGADSIYGIWKSECILSPLRKCTLTGFEIPSASANLVKVHYTVTSPLQLRTIIALYPHMLTDIHFIDKVMGKSLSTKVCKILYFHHETFQMVHLSREIDLVRSWFNLLLDKEMTARVVSQCRIKSSLVLLSDMEIHDALEMEQLQLDKVHQQNSRGRRRHSNEHDNETQLSAAHALVHEQTLLDNLIGPQKEGSGHRVRRPFADLPTFTSEEQKPSHALSLSYILGSS